MAMHCIGVLCRSWTAEGDENFSSQLGYKSGFQVNQDGIKPTYKKIEAIQKAQPLRKILSGIWLQETGLNFTSTFQPARPLFWNLYITFLTNLLHGNWKQAICYKLIISVSDLPICFAYSEQIYAHMDKEALVIIFTVKNFISIY